MNVIIHEEADVEPISLEAIKAHLRVTEDDENEYLEDLISHARATAENYTRRGLITRTVELQLDEWPEKEIVYLPYSPASEIEHLTYTTRELETVTLTIDEDFYFDANSMPARLIPVTSWPGRALKPISAISVKYECGHTAANIPKSILHGILMQISHLHEHREAVYAGYTVITTMPFGIETLWYPYRIWAPME